VTDGSAATVTGNTLSGLDRAGVLYDCSTGNLSDNTITSAEYGIAVQNLDSGPVDGATTGDNDISDISGSRVAEDAGLSISTAGWTPTGF